jgi:hypothetical protein
MTSCAAKADLVLTVERLAGKDPQGSPRHLVTVPEGPQLHRTRQALGFKAI